MTVKSKDKIEIDTIDGKTLAIAPVIISASRSTDIPAFYSEWFMNRLKAGYVKWTNPFNQKPLYISFLNTRVIVFWTKNAEKMIKYLSDIDKKGINCYFTFTINDYVEEGLEPRLPPLAKRIETFIKLSNMICKSRVIWRADPLILSEKLTTKILLDKIKKVGDQLKDYTEKLVISFADINCYRKVMLNLKNSKLGEFREFTEKEEREIAAGLYELNKNWKMEIATCAEKISLEEYGIKHNKCIDDDLMIKLWPEDSKLMEFLGYKPDLLSSTGERPNLKDKGQRKECGCIVSKDIGMYNTCGHFCVYCYANDSKKTVKKNMQKTRVDSESIV
jgi:DNA repair photolyase